MTAYSLEFWKTSLPLLDHWRALTPDQRFACFGIASRFVSGEELPVQLPKAVQEAFLETDGGGRFRGRKEFLRLQKALQRAEDWTRQDGLDLTQYVHQMTTHAQRSALTGNPGRSVDAVAVDLENRIQRGAYGKSLLASPTAESFLAEIGGWQSPERKLDEPAHKALQKWFRKKSEEDDPAKMVATETFRLPGSGLAPEEILFLILEYAVGILAVNPRTFQVLITLPTGRPKAAQGPRNIILKPFHGKDCFARPFLLDDMAAYLRSLQTMPAPLLSDGVNVPVAHHRKVAKGFQPLPFEVKMPGWEPERRAEAAWWMLMDLGLLADAGRSRKAWTAGPAPAADAWSKLSREKKLGTVLEKLPCGLQRVHEVNRRFSFLGDFAAHPFPYSALDLDLMVGLDQAVERLEKPVEYGDWIVSARSKANPFLSAIEMDAELAMRWRRWDYSPLEVYDRLLNFHVARFVSAGALALWLDDDGNLGISLTDVGRWLYGKADTWSLPDAVRAIAVVGGDLTVTLLEASLELEAELDAFAEPVSGRGKAGAAYKLTRASVQKAAHGGLEAERMIAVLKAWAKHALPSNVVHEITAWCGGRKTFRMREAILVEGDDPVAVSELAASAPKDFERVSPTVLAYIGKSKPGALAQRLGKKGFLFG